MSEQAQEATTVVQTQEQNAQPTQAPAKQEPATPEVPSQKYDNLSAKFAALAKKERQARFLSMQAKQKADTLTKREAAIAAREKQWEDEFRTSPLEALKKRNLTYQDLTQAALNDGKFQPDVEIKRVQDEIQRFRDEQAQKEKKALEDQRLAQQRMEAQVIAEYKERIGSHVEANSEKYELTKLYDAADLVFQTQEEHFNRTKKVLSLDEACGLVEQYLEDELERTSKESKKFKSKFLNAAQKVDAAKQEPKSSVTLQNSMQNSSAPSFLPAKTEADRIQRALAALGN